MWRLGSKRTGLQSGAAVVRGDTAEDFCPAPAADSEAGGRAAPRRGGTAEAEFDEDGDEFGDLFHAADDGGAGGAPRSRTGFRRQRESVVRVLKGGGRRSTATAASPQSSASTAASPPPATSGVGGEENHALMSAVSLSCGLEDASGETERVAAALMSSASTGQPDSARGARQGVGRNDELAAALQGAAPKAYKTVYDLRLVRVALAAETEGTSELALESVSVDCSARLDVERCDLMFWKGSTVRRLPVELLSGLSSVVEFQAAKQCAPKLLQRQAAPLAAAPNVEEAVEAAGSGPGVALTLPNATLFCVSTAAGDKQQKLQVRELAGIARCFVQYGGR